MQKRREKMDGGVYKVNTYTLNNECFFESNLVKLEIHKILDRDPAILPENASPI